MQTDQPGGGSLNNTAVRFRRRIVNCLSQLGGIATAVLGGGERVAAAGALDAEIHVGGSHFLSVMTALSTDSAEDAAASLRLVAEKRNKAGFAYRVGARHVDSQYRPPLGFTRRSGISILYAQVSHGSFGSSGFLQDRVLTTAARGVRRHGDHRIETASWSLSLNARRRGGGVGTAEIQARHEDVMEPFTVGETVVPAGTYDFAEAGLTIGLPAGWSRRATLAVSGGQYFDGSRVTVTLSPTWNVSRHLEVTADIETNWIRFPDRDQRFRGDIARLRIRASRDVHLSLYGLLQYNAILDRATGNLRLRYNFREGHDLYAVWNEGWAAEAGDWRAARRTLLVKYSRATWW